MSAFKLERYQPHLLEFKAAYASAAHFPHIMIDDFLDAKTLAEAVAHFPPLRDETWVHYYHFNEKKAGLNRREYMPAPLLAIMEELTSPPFVAFVSELTGIPDLKIDVGPEGGALQQSERGGFLNVHTDFAGHPHQRLWNRRVTLLLYLNPDWQEDYGGHLELWPKDMKACFEKILPIFNRCVIFTNSDISFHGHPVPMTCPPERKRNSLIIYYYTEGDKPVRRPTRYKARPEDGLKTLPILLDNAMVGLYYRLKFMLGASDAVASNVLRLLSRKKP